MVGLAGQGDLGYLHAGSDPHGHAPELRALRDVDVPAPIAIEAGVKRIHEERGNVERKHLSAVCVACE